MSRKRCHRKHYALLNTITHALLGAAITDAADLDKLRLIELSALEAFRTGNASRADWMACADMLNVCETLARDGVGPEALDACVAAQEALGNAKDRLDRIGKLGVSGPELQTLRHAYEFHDLQRTSISRSRYEQAIQKTAARIRSSHPSVKVYV